MIVRATFFARWRQYFGQLKQGQVDSLSLFLDHWEGLGLSDLRWLAYVLGTAHAEVGIGLQPVREGYAAGDAEARLYVARLLRLGRIRTNYALPDPATGKSYYGRGFVQLTHKENYQKLGQRLGLDLAATPDLALAPSVAVRVIFAGMTGGLFTGHRLADYFTPTRSDWTGARAIVNGQDRAAQVADLARGYFDMLTGADVTAAPRLPPDLPDVQSSTPQENSPMTSIIATFLLPFIRHQLTTLAGALVTYGILAAGQQDAFTVIVIGIITWAFGQGASFINAAKK